MTVVALDDVMVTRVTISVQDEAGHCLEEAEAELRMGVWWEVQPANMGQIQVKAWDLAGNVTVGNI